MDGFRKQFEPWNKKQVNEPLSAHILDPRPQYHELSKMLLIERLKADLGSLRRQLEEPLVLLLHLAVIIFCQIFNQAPAFPRRSVSGFGLQGAAGLLGFLLRQASAFLVAFLEMVAPSSPPLVEGAEGRGGAIESNSPAILTRLRREWKFERLAKVVVNRLGQ